MGAHDAGRAVILWINGAFGAGKTQVAHELARRLDDGWVADPEHLGFAVRRMTPPSLRAEFQRHAAWRRAVVDVLDEIEASGDATIVVPQALLDPTHHADIVGTLREHGHRVDHVTLAATATTLTRRLRSRGELHGTWARRQVDRCVAALEDPVFAEHVTTDGRSIDEVVEQIARRTGLALARGRRPFGVRQLSRLHVTLRHVRRIG